MESTPPHRRGRLLRIIALVVGGIVVLAVAGIAVFIATFNLNSYKPQIVAAVDAATGRQLTIGGRIGLSLSLQPTLEVTKASLSNPPGFSRPQMVTLRTLRLQLALIPLLSKHLQIAQLTLEKPNILLETNAQGQSNWQFAPAAAATVASPAKAPAATPPAAPPPTAPASVPPASAPPASAPVPAANAAPLPLSISLSSLKIEGGTLAMRDASGQTKTLALKQLTASAASPRAPLHVTADATYDDAPVSLIADTGPLAGLMGGKVPWPVRLTLAAGGATFTIDGAMAKPAEGRGLAAAMTAGIPDLAALSPLAGTALPPLKTIAAQFRLTEANGGDGIAITDLKLTLPSADLSGSVSVMRGARPLVTANLSAKRIDLDALQRSLAPAKSAKPAAGTLPIAGTMQTKEVAAKAPAASSGRVIPDTRLPFDALRLADTNIQLAVEDLRTGGQDYKSVKLHAVAKDGQVTLDPFTLDAPGGQVDVKATVDATQAAPPVTLTLRAPALALQPLLKALGKPGYASGTLELRADLHGAGDTPHAIAASLDGAVGAAVAKGQIDSRLLGSLMSNLLQQTDLSRLATKAGMSTLNCFALRIDANHGVGTVNALLLDTSTLGMTGTGTLNFGTEALDLHLRPTAGLAGTTVAAPLIVGGDFADPSVRADIAGTVTGNAGTAAKLALGASTGGLALVIGSAIDQKLSGDACAAPLALARFAQPPAAGAPSSGAAPAAGSEKSSKPSNSPLNSLKNLFQ